LRTLYSYEGLVLKKETDLKGLQNHGKAMVPDFLYGALERTAELESDKAKCKSQTCEFSDLEKII
jgi:hypothetical protein